MMQATAQDHSGSVRHIIRFLSMIILGAAALIFLLAGILQPVSEAIRRRIDADTETIVAQAKIDAERATIDLAHYKAQLELALQTERRSAEQALAKKAQDFQQDQNLKAWAIPTLIVVLFVVLAIPACALAYYVLVRARQIRSDKDDARLIQEVVQELAELRQRHSHFEAAADAERQKLQSQVAWLEARTAEQTNELNALRSMQSEAPSSPNGHSKTPIIFPMDHRRRKKKYNS